MKRLKKYADERVDRLTALLAKGNNTYSDENFHDFRTEVKKVQFLANLIHFSNKDFSKNLPGELTRLFKKAGEVRDIYITLVILGKDASSLLYAGTRRYLYNELDERKRKFFYCLSNTSLKVINTWLKTLHQELTKLPEHTVRRFLHRQESRLQENLDLNTGDSRQMHMARKRVKHLLYCRAVLPKTHHGEENLLERLNDAIGKWHDYVIAGEQIKHLLQKKQTAGDVTQQLLENLISRSVYSTLW